MLIFRSIVLFIFAGLCEIGGGYLVWQWLRGGKSFLLGLFGALVLVLYGVIPTFQPDPNFGRIYAAYGGIFVVMSLLWGWYFDHWNPDRYDLLGAGLAVAGVAVMMWWPRG